jgi:hypothetical protein
MNTRKEESSEELKRLEMKVIDLNNKFMVSCAASLHITARVATSLTSVSSLALIIVVWATSAPISKLKSGTKHAVPSP